MTMREMNCDICVENTSNTKNDNRKEYCKYFNRPISQIVQGKYCIGYSKSDTIKPEKIEWVCESCGEEYPCILQLNPNSFNPERCPIVNRNPNWRKR